MGSLLQISAFHSKRAVAFGPTSVSAGSPLSAWGWDVAGGHTNPCVPAPRCKAVTHICLINASSRRGENHRSKPSAERELGFRCTESRWRSVVREG